MRSEPTPAEARLWHSLRAKRFENAKFRHQTPVGPFVADFTCRSAMLAIELDGDSHGTTGVYDARRTAFVESRGWRVIRFLNSDVMGNLEGVLLVIKAELTRPPLPGPLP